MTGTDKICELLNDYFHISGAINCYCSNPGYCIIPLNRQHTICQGSRECRLFRVITLNRAVSYTHL